MERRLPRAAGVIAILLVAFLLHACSDRSPWSDATAYDSSPSWSPDGSRIAYVHRVSLEPGPDAYPDGVYVLDLDTGQRRRVLSDVAVGLDWSPDGRHLVLAIGNGVYRLELETGTLSLLCSKVARYPSWSPDGTTIAFDDVQHVWLVDSAGGEPRRLRPADDALGFGNDPDWSPDGHSLVVLLRIEPGSFSEMCVVDGDGNLIKRLTGNLP